jgi:hypothetical protein
VCGRGERGVVVVAAFLSSGGLWEEKRRSIVLIGS